MDKPAKVVAVKCLECDQLIFMPAVEGISYGPWPVSHNYHREERDKRQEIKKVGEHHDK